MQITEHFQPTSFIRRKFPSLYVVFFESLKDSRNNFRLVGFLMKSERDSSVPGRLENRIRNGFAIRAVIPLRQIRIASSVIRWRFDLDSIDAATAFKSVKKRYIFLLNKTKSYFKFWCDANLSWVSLDVSSSNLNKSRKSDRLKWRSTSSSLSTTQELSAFLWAWRWKIFSSMVPVFVALNRPRIVLLLFVF